MRGLRLSGLWLAISAVCVLTLRGVQALADGDLSTDEVPALLAYEGTLDKDGAAYTGSAELIFQLYDGVGAVVAAWTEEQTVYVERGRFSVLLGSDSDASSMSLRALLGSSDDIYLSVTLVVNDAPYPFARRQRLLSAATALWAPTTSETTLSKRVVIESELVPSASDAPLVVASDDTSNTLRLGPNRIELGTGSIDTNVSVGGKVIAPALVMTAAALSHQSGDQLVINDVTSASDGGVTVSGKLDVSGVSVSGLSASVKTSTGCVDYDLGLTTGTLYQTCPAGSVWIGGNFQGINNNGKFVQIMRCCAVTVSVQ